MKDIRIELGTRADFLALAHHHYRIGAPATCVRVLRAVPRSGSAPTPHIPGTPRLSEPQLPVGVLVVSMPVLNGAWRDAAWPGWLTGCDPRERAVHLNRSLRAISRLIVAPEWRGLGIGRALVRAYLDDPDTERTEAIASMGAFCPVFAAAGMREIQTRRCRRDLSLEHALVRARIEPWRLIDEHERRVFLRDDGGELERAARTWGRSHRLIRDRGARGVPVPTDEILALAASRLCERVRAFVSVAA